jgi:hypothetical protein
MLKRIRHFTSTKSLLVASAVIASAASFAIVVAGPTVVRAQEPLSKFEVTSVRPNKGGAPRYDINPKGNRFVATNVSVFVLVEWAYRMQAFGSPEVRRG